MRVSTVGGVPLAALAPLVLFALAFIGYCWFDLTRAAHVRHLPKWAWAVICLISVPIGGIVYLLIGKEHE